MRRGYEQEVIALVLRGSILLIVLVVREGLEHSTSAL
ncbi:MAG: hypothetical protein QOI88_4282 [Gammaproteobacteria bacterium]|jgi:hypothetical protein|nr:hypothetical protein [Gammaproteobacteria bacterium]